MDLRQSTASQEILLGPFVDDTDGKTPKNALTIANTDIKLFKSGATSFTDKNSGGATFISNGNYYAVLDATDSNTVGNLEIMVQVTGALPVRREYSVLPAAVYDAVYGSSNLQVDVVKWNGDAVPTSDTAGYPKVTIKDGTGTGELDTNAGKISVATGGIAAASFAAGAITASAFAAGAIDAAALATDAATEIATAVNTQTLTEAYAADGAAATPAQLLHMIWSAVGQFDISSTTLTARKLDGTTSSMTFTLNDATNPTSRTRAT